MGAGTMGHGLAQDFAQALNQFIDFLVI